MKTSLIENYIGSVKHDGQEVTATLCFPPDFEGFQGHFPGQPVVPGICWIQAGMLLGRNMNPRLCRLGNVAAAKFYSVVLPGQEVHVRCTIRGNAVVADFMRQNNRVAHIKLEMNDA